MLKDFDKFMSQLKETNQTLDFFCDFEKNIAERRGYKVEPVYAQQPHWGIRLAQKCRNDMEQR